jgi:hypothetical protein
MVAAGSHLGAPSTQGGKVNDVEDNELEPTAIEDERGVDLPPGDARLDGEPDVLLDVPELRVDEIALEVENLQAHVALQADVLELLKLHVGVDAVLGRVQLTIKGVEAKVLLKVHLDNVARILDRVLTTIDNNPAIVERLTEQIGRAAEEVGAGAGRAVGEVGTGAGRAVGEVGAGAGSAVEDLGEGGREAVGSVGQGVDRAVEDVGRGAGSAVGDVGDAAGEAVEEVGGKSSSRRRSRENEDDAPRRRSTGGEPSRRSRRKDTSSGEGSSRRRRTSTKRRVEED